VLPFLNEREGEKKENLTLAVNRKGGHKKEKRGNRTHPTWTLEDELNP